MERNISKPEDRAFCGMGCGAVLVHVIGNTRKYPDFCTECEKKILRQMEKRGGKLSQFKRKKLGA